MRRSLGLCIALSVSSGCAERATDVKDRADASACAASAAATRGALRYQFVHAVQVVTPSVVSVSGLSLHDIDEALDEEPAAFPYATPRRGQGSGVIVDASGLVLTSGHLVEGASELRVVLPNGHERGATLIGSDAETDLALIKVQAEGETFQPAPLGDSAALQVGEWVIAAGSPFGLQRTMSVGIVSALGRGDLGISEVEDFIQTDAAINPGNSGGPLVDIDGNVVGINLAIASPAAANSGIGFAIPIAIVKPVLQQLKARGSVIHGYAGLYASDVTDVSAKAAGFLGEGGVVVLDVATEGPAERAGLRVGDIIETCDGRPLLHAAALRNTVAESTPGTALTLRVFRERGTLTVTLELTAPPTFLPRSHDTGSAGSPP